MRLADGIARVRAVSWLAAVALAGTPGCDVDTFLNSTASLGGNTPGSRGNIRIGFINHTPFRAVFTYGTYDPQNPDFQPRFRQFFIDASASNRLEGNSDSPIVTLTCARAVSLGGAEFIQRLKDANLVASASEEALEPGIAFSDRPLDDPQAGQATAGRAPAVLTLQGAEFQCDSLLLYTFELDDTQPSGFRVDLQVILP